MTIGKKVKKQMDINELFGGVAYGVIGGAVLASAGYLKAKKEEPKEVFNYSKFGITVIIGGLAGAFYSAFIGTPDIVETGAFAGFVEVMLNRFGLKA
jgi:hypothetical protein